MIFSCFLCAMHLEFDLFLLLFFGHSFFRISLQFFFLINWKQHTKNSLQHFPCFPLRNESKSTAADKITIIFLLQLLLFAFPLSLVDVPIIFIFPPFFSLLFFRCLSDSIIAFGTVGFFTICKRISFLYFSRQFFLSPVFCWFVRDDELTFTRVHCACLN